MLLWDSVLNIRVDVLRGSPYMIVFCFQAEDGIRDLVRSRGLGDVYKRQNQHFLPTMNNIFKGLIAGYGANKLGGGCLGTIVVLSLIHI